MAIFSSLTSLFSGQSSSSSASADEPTLAQAAHNRSKSKGKMALNRQDSDVYTSSSEPVAFPPQLETDSELPLSSFLQRLGLTVSNSPTTSPRASACRSTEQALEAS